MEDTERKRKDFERVRLSAQGTRRRFRPEKGPPRSEALYHQYAEEAGVFISDCDGSLHSAGIPAYSDPAR